MNELLQKLLESQVLSPETKSELENAFNTKIEQAITEAREQATADVQAELTQKFVEQRDQLIEAVDTKVGEFLNDEITELKEDIERFRDLEAEYAEKLVEAKAAMGEELKADLGELVDKLDVFLEMRLSAELEELREDVAEVRKNEFGRQIFEAFQSEFAQFSNDDTATSSLAEAEAKLAELAEAAQAAEQKLAEYERKEKMNAVLKPLSGRSREVMEAILNNVATEKLEEAYKTFIGRVVREATTEVSEKEDKVLAESASDKKVVTESVKKELAEAVVATGDTDIITEEAKMSDDRKRDLEYIRRLAGLNK